MRKHILVLILLICFSTLCFALEEKYIGIIFALEGAFIIGLSIIVLPFLLFYTDIGLKLSTYILKLFGIKLILETNKENEKNFKLIKIKNNIPIIQENKAPKDNREEGLRKIEILLAEDNIINQEVIREYFREKNLEINVANNGTEAVTMCKEKKYDLILMDIQMPIMDGTEAARIIRGIDINKKTKIVILSAETNIKADSYMKFFDGILIKPIDFERMDEILLTLFKKEETKTKIEILLEKFNNDEEIFKKIYHINMENYEKQIKELIASIETEDYQKVGELAHKFKSSLGLLGEDVVKYFKQIQENARGERNKGIILKITKEMMQYIEQLKQEVDEYLKKRD